jgi:FkbM family methyltransferase
MIANIAILTLIEGHMIYMLPQEIVEKYGQFRGVLHVGSHYAEERNAYIEAGINKRIWIDANPYIVDNLKQQLSEDPNDRVIHAAISEFDGETVQFNIANNGQSSSILPLKLHKNIYRDISYTGCISLKAKSLKTILDSVHDSQDFDFINLDIQGVELRALKGLYEKIDQFRAVYTEINVLELYDSCDMMHNIDEFLTLKGFEKVGYKLWGNDGWGDALYVRPQ